MNRKRAGIKTYLGDVSDRTIDKYEAAGMPFYKLPTGGKLYNEEKVQEWLEQYCSSQQKEVADDLFEKLVDEART